MMIGSLREMLKDGRATLTRSKLTIRVNGRPVTVNRGLVGNHERFRRRLAEKGFSGADIETMVDGETDLVEAIRDAEVTPKFAHA